MRSRQAPVLSPATVEIRQPGIIRKYACNIGEPRRETVIVCCLRRSGRVLLGAEFARISFFTAAIASARRLTTAKLSRNPAALSCMETIGMAMAAIVRPAASVASAGTPACRTVGVSGSVSSMRRLPDGRPAGDAAATSTWSGCTPAVPRLQGGFHRRPGHDGNVHRQWLPIQAAAGRGAGEINLIGPRTVCSGPSQR